MFVIKIRIHFQFSQTSESISNGKSRTKYFEAKSKNSDPSLILTIKPHPNTEKLCNKQISDREIKPNQYTKASRMPIAAQYKTSGGSRFGFKDILFFKSEIHGDCTQKEYDLQFK